MMALKWGISVLLFTGNEVSHSEIRVPVEDEMVWAHFGGTESEALQNALQDVFCIHPLAVEDAVHFGQRPKVDVYPSGSHPHALVSFYAVTEDFDPMELCLIVGRNFFISVTQSEIPWIEELYRRAGVAGIGRTTPTELLHRVLDGCVDSTTNAIDRLEHRLEGLEQRVFRHPHHEIASTVFRAKRNINRLRKLTIDERAAIGTLKHDTFPFVSENYAVYFEDVFDHVSRAIDSFELLRDGLTALLDFQASQRAQAMNQVMKTLAIISTIFLPLSFIVGLYGMNFHDIPELSWKFGYLYVWLLLLSVAGSFIFYFKKRGWW